MAKPSLLLYTTDNELETKLLAIPSIANFRLIHVKYPDSWVDRLIEEKVDVVIAEAENVNEDDLKKLADKSNVALSEMDVIFISSGEPNSLMDQAMLQGVSYHLRYPINISFVEEIVTELYEELSSKIINSEAVVESDLDQFGLLVGSSPKMRRLYRVIRKTADSNASVFIIGESGSGKELVANTLHMMSDRNDQPFISINCGAISPELIESELFGHVKGAFTGAISDRVGVFEQADSGTLFLDEVTEMPIEHQVKLLRVLETGEYKKVGGSGTQVSNARIISATNRDPAEAIRDELFREDLYYRLAQFPIEVPSLREREDDILGLAKHFLAHRNAQENTTKEINTDTLKKIKTHDWPGNVRELMHAIERAYILAGDVIMPHHLIVDTVTSTNDIGADFDNMPLDEIEKSAILRTLEEKNGNKTEAAEVLGVSVKTLYNKLEKYGKVDD